MCLIFVAHRVREDYPLVVAANRDEFHARESLPAAWWADAPGVLAGRDARAGGTWLGVDVRGRFSAITNYRGGTARDDAPSRGELVSGFLLGSDSPADYAASLALRGRRYNGFSLFAGRPGELCWYSNAGGEAGALGPGLYGLSNAMLDTPWPKLTRGKAMMRQALDSPRVEPEALLDLLADRGVTAGDALPDTGIGPEREKLLAPIFIRAQPYGTRCSTAIVVHRTGAARFVERRYDAQGRTTGTEDYTLELGDESASARAGNIAAPRPGRTA